MATQELLKAMTHGARAWDLMYEIFRASKPYLESIVTPFDITSQQMFALKILNRDQPMQMSALAAQLGCDASNVTSIVDKLETRGIVARRSDERDRRVKAIVITEIGKTIVTKVELLMRTPPPAIANLDAADQHALCEILGRAIDSLSQQPTAATAGER